MNLKEMQEKRAEAKMALEHYSTLIIETVETATFTGKEILDALKEKEDVKDGTTADDLIAQVMMEIIQKREDS